MELSFGYSKANGFSFALAGTAQGGAIAGAGAFVGGGITITDACSVNQLSGTAYQAGRAGLGPIAVEGLKGDDYYGGSLYGGYGAGFTANSLTTSTTSSIFQYDNGTWSLGNAGSDSIWSQR